MKSQQSFAKNYRGFTIVELLIVIVVIAILATLTIVAYNGIQQRAHTATVQSDLENATKKLEMDNTLAGAYPASVDLANEGHGLAKSTGTSYQYTFDSVANTYCLTATNAGISYYVSSTNNIPTKGACVGQIDGGAPAIAWTQVVAGYSFSAGLRSDNTIYSWGVNPTGQFGNNST